MSMAIYAGTFDPFTKGHWSVVQEALSLFSHVRILIAVNPKKTPKFPVSVRRKIIKASFPLSPSVSLDATTRYVVEYAKDMGATYLVRGIRSVSDGEYELKIAEVNRKLAPEIKTVFLPADPELSAVSSTMLKQRFEAGEDIAQYCATSTAKTEILAELVHQQQLAQQGNVVVDVFGNRWKDDEMIEFPEQAGFPKPTRYW